MNGRVKRRIKEKGILYFLEKNLGVGLFLR